MPPMFLASIIAAAIAGAAGFGLAWRLQSANILEMTNEAKDLRISASMAARASIERATSAVIAAQNDASARGAVLRRDADLARSGLDGLRSSTDAAMRAAATSLDACNLNAIAVSQLLNQCGGEYQAMGAIADGHASDVRLLQDAWPR